MKQYEMKIKHSQVMYPSHYLLKIIGYSNNMIKNQKFKLKIKKKSVLIGVGVRVADIAAIFFLQLLLVFF